MSSLHSPSEHQRQPLRNVRCLMRTLFSRNHAAIYPNKGVFLAGPTPPDGEMLTGWRRQIIDILNTDYELDGDTTVVVPEPSEGEWRSILVLSDSRYIRASRMIKLPGNGSTSVCATSLLFGYQFIGMSKVPGTIQPILAQLLVGNSASCYSSTSTIHVGERSFLVGPMTCRVLAGVDMPRKFMEFTGIHFRQNARTSSCAIPLSRQSPMPYLDCRLGVHGPAPR